MVYAVHATIGVSGVRIFVVQEQLSMILGFCTILHGGLLGSETVSTGSFDACAVDMNSLCFYSTRTSARR